ncbi:DEAD/DEAH box helicase [Actinoplanes sp. ATCC 53533]|uniref:DEAD/DEAH box helicase n=1 Tax=Actinoplanes sp. ATCC 53533 TaxID=1288362 RepID=UPI000F7AC2E1|nr:DEAD/DEAH box helicase [Actinoplanes sp. ATCC 53533]RSM56876.1 DEAD/DEAH box helicase [Actinoplanes sp. ATCC 53533]
MTGLPGERRGAGRRLRRLKISDPDLVPEPEAGVDLRVLLPAEAAFDAVAEKIQGDGAEVRRVRFLVEDETIVGPRRLQGRGRWQGEIQNCRLVRPFARAPHRVDGADAVAAADAFDVLWDAHAPVPPDAAAVAVEQLVPSGWGDYFPHPQFNPAQAEAVPVLLENDDNVVVVAPTGAGKTVMGMAVSLRTILQQGRKAAWLVPQRSLTDELNRDLELWRRQGLRVERLSGEHTVDEERIARADLWVATTEKFEAICRMTSLRDALADVGSIVVDEIHLLGDAGRGAVLEALLARMRDGGAPMRLVGLSATVSNAEQIAEWLRARLVRISWRPTRLTWQVPQIAAHSDWNVTEATRTRLAAAITGRVTADGGSVLVFCGSKRHVRRTALVIAAFRGAAVHDVHADDTDRVHQVCRAAGVGLHYTGWEHRHQAEQEFRERRLDVLVATSTLAAGVNLPARAVVIRDTQVGLDSIDIGTVQQMFGRAGRFGAGEREGSAFLIADVQERSAWLAGLVRGNRVQSQIEASLPDHLLGEVVQGKVSSLTEAEQWWVQTLAHHQGSRSREPVHRAIDFLGKAGLLAVAPDSATLQATPLGLFTARLMVSTTVTHALRRSLSEADQIPATADQAEWLVIDRLCALVPKLAQASVGEGARAEVARFLSTSGADAGGEAVLRPGDVARAALLAVARAPELFSTGVRDVEGMPYSAMYSVLEEAPRYLHWLGGQGLFGTLHPWAAIVAADLGRRIHWRNLQPRRGAGRLLWICEQLATPAHAEAVVPKLFTAATARGIVDPDWPGSRAPAGARLDEPGHRALLRERGGACSITVTGDEVRATGPAGSVLATWTGTQHARTPIRTGAARAARPAAPGGAAVFTWRGDHLATGWLSVYARHGYPDAQRGTGQSSGSM